MSDIIGSAIDIVTRDLNRTFDFHTQELGELTETLLQTGQQSLSSGISLTQGYYSRVGTDLLPSRIGSLANPANDVFLGVRIGVNNVAQASSKPDTDYDGMFVGANGQTFPPPISLNRIPAVQPSNGSRPIETVIYINGINTTKDQQAASLQAIADRTGAQVIGIHNATEGIITDLGQSIGDKLDKGNNPAVDTLADTVYNELKRGRTVHLLAHSQGGLITSRALNDVYQRLRVEDGLMRDDVERMLGRVKVETFGAAAGHYPNGPQYVHYINRDDPVPTLFGLGTDLDRFNPTLNAGRGAKVHWFTDRHANPIDSHSFEDVYLPRRVSFDRARRGNFN